MEKNPTVIAEADDNPNKDINVSFFNIPFTKRYSFFFSHSINFNSTSTSLVVDIV